MEVKYSAGEIMTGRPTNQQTSDGHDGGNYTSNKILFFFMVKNDA